MDFINVRDNDEELEKFAKAIVKHNGICILAEKEAFGGNAVMCSTCPFECHLYNGRPIQDGGPKKAIFKAKEYLLNIEVRRIVEEP